MSEEQRKRKNHTLSPLPVLQPAFSLYNLAHCFDRLLEKSSAMEKFTIIAVPPVRRRKRSTHRTTWNRSSFPALLAKADNDRPEIFLSSCLTSPIMRASQFLFSTAPLYMTVSASPSCFSPCAALVATLPGAVAFPDTPAYAESNTYWSNRQSEVQPTCFVTPDHGRSSGGHTAFAGASNAQGGVTLDLRNLNKIVVSGDHETVSVGPGNRWIEISTVLEPLGLAVVGGRAADVGVSGLILGGGISYFSGRRGWACDNVRAFEVVLASGKIVKASATENKDLFWALRGGRPLVRRLHLPGAMASSLIPHFVDLTMNGLPSDLDAHSYFVATEQPALGGPIVLTSFYHANPPSADSVPPVFQNLRDQPNAIYSSSAVANVSTLSRNIDQPYGQRQTWWDTTIRVARVMAAANGTPLTPFLVFQPISTNIIEGMQKNGGNALGLKPEDGPLMIVQTSASWDDGSIDSIVEESCQRFISEVEELAKQLDVPAGPVYMNYAGSKQRVLESYGDESFKRLKATANKYDPKGKLHSLWTGYFKV
ncbi:unnamed protein product [Parascedosporium putredinis]|uniref:FAD-binding PCMH-type domain-containing protein n=1 Tax=Parascedosporium putredinis TaxID=1442378 RepID=A0A9P1MBS9_9PEZI|nr:unnamed protein product [Parascedosporium putredinis]CAI7995362.1 unnamed protein product [Parascedosporium putredinis]